MYEPLRKTTIADLARELRLTPSTISRALNDHPAISASTKNAVRSLAQLRHYQPNKIASTLRLGKSLILGVLIPSAEISFFASVIHGIENIARQNGYSVLIYQSNEDEENERKGVYTFLRSRVACVLASLSRETTHLQHFADLKHRRVPLVLFDRTNDAVEVPSVVIDDYKGAFKATSHLLKQGCRRIAHIAGQQDVAIFKQRLKGYVDALKQHQLPIDDDLIAYGKVTSDSGREQMNCLLSRSQPPDAVFAVEDFTALGAMQALKAAAIKIPDEVALIGFANESFSQYVTPALSTVDPQATLMGEEAAKMFFQLSETNDFYQNNPGKKVLEPALICRASSLKKAGTIP